MRVPTKQEVDLVLARYDRALDLRDLSRDTRERGLRVNTLLFLAATLRITVPYALAAAGASIGERGGALHQWRGIESSDTDSSAAIGLSDHALIGTAAKLI